MLHYRIYGFLTHGFFNWEVASKFSFYLRVMKIQFFVNPLSASPEKWSNTLKQIVDNLPTICLSVFDHFINLALKGLIFEKWH